MVVKPNNNISKTRSLYSIALDIGVSVDTLRKYSLGIKVKPATREQIENYFRRNKC